MAKEFTFEEAVGPATGAAAPKEFSFEEAMGVKVKPKEGAMANVQRGAESMLSSQRTAGLMEI